MSGLEEPLPSLLTAKGCEVRQGVEVLGREMGIRYFWDGGRTIHNVCVEIGFNYGWGARLGWNPGSVLGILWVPSLEKEMTLENAKASLGLLIFWRSVVILSWKIPPYKWEAKKLGCRDHLYHTQKSWKVEISRCLSSFLKSVLCSAKTCLWRSCVRTRDGLGDEWIAMKFSLRPRRGRFVVWRSKVIGSREPWKPFLVRASEMKVGASFTTLGDLRVVENTFTNGIGEK